jgi:hypothetical protein
VACILQTARNQSTRFGDVHMLSFTLSTLLDNIGPSSRHKACGKLNFIHLFKVLSALIEEIYQK